MAFGARGRERRKASRSTVLKCAQLVAGDQVHDCVILDSSETGVRVHVRSADQLPARMELRLEGGFSIPARRCWGRGTELGLEFAR